MQNALNDTEAEATSEHMENDFGEESCCCFLEMNSSKAKKSQGFYKVSLMFLIHYQD